MLKHKYRAIPTELDGIKFPSKAHAKYHAELELRKKAGEVLFFLREVPFHLPGATTYRLDYLEFHADGSIHPVEVKGFETAVFKVKKRLVEAIYPIKIELAKLKNGRFNITRD